MVFDADVEDRKALDKNIEMLRKYCSKVTVINMMQVLDFEDEIVRSTDVSKAQELTKSRSVSNFKTDFCRMKVSDCGSLLERHQFDIKKMWTAEPPTAFMDLKQESCYLSTVCNYDICNTFALMQDSVHIFDIFIFHAGRYPVYSQAEAGTFEISDYQLFIMIRKLGIRKDGFQILCYYIFTYFPQHIYKNRPVP